jgi:hypothetical protein
MEFVSQLYSRGVLTHEICITTIFAVFKRGFATCYIVLPLYMYSRGVLPHGILYSAVFKSGFAKWNIVLPLYSRGFAT